MNKQRTKHIQKHSSKIFQPEKTKMDVARCYILNEPCERPGSPLNISNFGDLSNRRSKDRHVRWRLWSPSLATSPATSAANLRHKNSRYLARCTTMRSNAQRCTAMYSAPKCDGALMSSGCIWFADVTATFVHLAFSKTVFGMPKRWKLQHLLPYSLRCSPYVLDTSSFFS